MPLGPILLTVLLVLIYFGFLDRVLDRMRLTARQALFLSIAMLAGSLVEIGITTTLSVNLGGGVIPLGIVVYLLTTADEWYEPVRAVAAAAVTAGAVYLVGRWFPPGEPTELNLFFLDAQYLYGLVAGLTGYLAGRSRRSAFCAGVLGVFLADLAHWAWYALPSGQADLVVRIGGGGFQDTAVVAGVLGVVLAEVVGETREAISHAAAGDEDRG